MTQHQQRPVADRIERERAWHDRRFEENPHRGQAISSLTGGLTLEAVRRVYAAAKANCHGKDVLDYGCSFGEASLIFRSSYGATSVEGIDISPVAVKAATAAAERKGLTAVRFQTMNAEVLDFPDASFDLVFGIAILHHLNVDRAAGEIARVLRPKGVAVFLEPLGHNPLINLVRRATPADRTEDEHPLMTGDFKVLRRHFGTIDTEYVNFLTLLTAPLVGVPGREPLRKSLNAVDRVLLRALPPLGKYAWNVVMTLKDPQTRSM